MRMLVGHVSDELYVAIPDALLEFRQNGQMIATARSTVRGGIHADIEPGPYSVSVSKPGFGSKTSDIDVDENRPVSLRLLSDRLLGHVWPQWSRSGERA